MKFKDALVLVRARLNMSQEKLASLLNVSYITVNRWENGNTNPTKKAYVAFVEFCKNNDIDIDLEENT